jgi:hypothetical protein
MGEMTHQHDSIATFKDRISSQLSQLVIFGANGHMILLQLNTTIVIVIILYCIKLYSRQIRVPQVLYKNYYSLGF